jgi:hypothetical protein
LAQAQEECKQQLTKKSGDAQENTGWTEDECDTETEDTQINSHRLSRQLEQQTEEARKERQDFLREKTQSAMSRCHQEQEELLMCPFQQKKGGKLRASEPILDLLGHVGEPPPGMTEKPESAKKGSRSCALAVSEPPPGACLHCDSF